MSWIPTLTCLVIPILLFAVIRKAWIRNREAALFRNQHPDEPWLWRRDWASHTAADKAHELSWLIWPFAVMWNLISLPTLYVLRGKLESDPLYYVFLLFPVIGAALIVAAIYMTLRRRKYAASVCHFDALPIPLGRTVRGEVDTRATDVPEQGFLVRLTNLRRVVKRSGKSTTVQESILWQDEQRVGAGAAMPGPNGVRVPFRFALPADAEPADDRDARDRIVWRLEVTGEVPGIDYRGVYELPVFTRAESPESFVPQPVTPWSPPPNMTFGISPTGADQVTIRSQSRPQDWIFNIFFFAIWFGALTFMQRAGVPWFAVLFFVLIGIAVAMWSIDFMAGRSIIAADRTELRFRRSIFGTRVVPATDVISIQPVIGTTVAGRALYNLVATLRSGRTSTIAWHLRTRRDAEMLAERVMKTLGVITAK